VTPNTLTPPPDISDVRYDDKLVVAVAEAGVFLASRGLTERVAVGVLHGHFPFGADEALLEVIEPGARSKTAQVVSRSALGDALPSTWRFESDGKPAPMVWSTGAIEHLGLGSELEAAVAEFGAFLARQSLTDVLAVVPVGGTLLVGPGEVVLEVTDTDLRVQVTRVVPRNDVGDASAAAWDFDLDGHPIKMGWCSSSNDGKGGFH
jgi:hypothetical protein